MKATTLTLAALMAFGMLAGCATNKPVGFAAASEVESTPHDGSYEARYAPDALPEPPAVPRRLNTVEFLDAKLPSKVAVQNTQHRRTGGSTFEVLASFKNLTDETVRIKVRTQYFDASRLHQEGPGAWKLLFIPAHSIETYKTYTYRTDTEFYLVEAAPLKQ